MKEITAKELQQQLEAGKTLNILDVRETAEVAGGHIEGSLNIPLGLLEFRMNELDKSKQYHVICLAGGRSAQATQFLQSHGYDVTNVAGGMSHYEGKIK